MFNGTNTLKQYLKDTVLPENIKIYDEFLESNKIINVKNDKIKLKCKKHNIDFFKTPTQIRNRTHLCEKCRNQRITDSKLKHNISHYLDYKNFDYYLTKEEQNFNKVEQTKEIKVTCKKHNYTFETTLANHGGIVAKRGGRGCPKCKSDRMSESRRKYNNIEDVIKDIEESDKYTYELNYPFITVICKKHGRERKHIKALRRSRNPCWACANEKMAKDTQMSWEEFKERTDEIYIDNNILCNNWNGLNKTKIIYKCKIHGLVEQSAIHRLHHDYQSDNGCPKCSLKSSKGEQELSKFVEDLGIKIELNDRKILPKGKELDIVCKEQKIAIEFNGMHWHSEGYKHNNYHIEKLNLANDAGYELIQVNENEWVLKQQIIKSIISSRFGIFLKTIFARKTDRRNISSKDARGFLEENHIQGFRSGNKYLGLFLEEELVSVAVSASDGELVRFCNKNFYNIIGGFNKLLKELDIKYSFVDKRLFNGISYFKNDNFKLLYSTKPNYKYVKGLSIWSRQSFQKHKLEEKLKVFDKSLTEVENMNNNGYRRFFDCGNYKFEYIGK